jgi:hypothetical protein
MQEDWTKKRTFYFQAGTSTVGGVVTGQTFAPGASALVPSAGGASRTQRDGLEAVDSIISFGPTDANGSGQEDDSSQEQDTAASVGEGEKHWSIQVNSTVDNLNILTGKVQAATIVTNGTALYRRNCEPVISFSNSQFTGLTINGCNVTVSFSKGIRVCGDFGRDLPQQICIVDSVTVEGTCPGIEKLDDHTLQVAGVGTLIFGEGVKFPNGPVQVCLLRIELDTDTKIGDGRTELKAENVTLKSVSGGSNGAAATGMITVGAGVVGGSPMPPT